MNYPSDLTDQEWEMIENFFVRSDPRGAKPKHDTRLIINAILYLVKGGVQWRMLPKDFPPWQTVYDHYRDWSTRGIWEKILHFLNEEHRKKQGRKAKPSYGIIDSQSVKTQYGSEERGIDGGKKVKGHKRHIVVDSLGNLLHVQVHAANIHDTKAGCKVFKETQKKWPSIEAYSGDAGYSGTAVNYVEQVLQLKLHISKKIKDDFAVLPKRWIVERTLAWMGNFRRLAKDFEILVERAENLIQIAMMKITLAQCVT